MKLIKILIPGLLIFYFIAKEVFYMGILTPDKIEVLGLHLNKPNNISKVYFHIKDSFIDRYLPYLNITSWYINKRIKNKESFTISFVKNKQENIIYKFDSLKPKYFQDKLLKKQILNNKKCIIFKDKSKVNYFNTYSVDIYLKTIKNFNYLTILYSKPEYLERFIKNNCKE